MQELLGSEAAAAAVASNMVTLFHNGGASASSSSSDATPKRANPFEVRRLESEPMPACTAWMNDDLSSFGLGPPRTYVLRVSNDGSMTMFLNERFEDEVDTMEGMRAMFVAKVPPPCIHREDCHKIMLGLDTWKALSSPVQMADGTLVRTTYFEVDGGLRARVKKRPHNKALLLLCNIQTSSGAAKCPSSWWWRTMPKRGR
jgi:hypothetical protein